MTNGVRPVPGYLAEVQPLEGPSVAVTFIAEALAPIGGSFRIGPVSATEATGMRDRLPPRCWQ